MAKDLPAGLPKRHLLVAVDESEASSKACDWALENLYREGDMLHLFHVISPGQHIVLASDMVNGLGAGIEEIVEDSDEEKRKAEEHARQFLMSKYTGKLDAKKVPYQAEIVRFATDNDSIGSVICKRAEQLNAAAVVLAKHNKGAITEFFVGSVANYASHHAKCPVLIMHCD